MIPKGSGSENGSFLQMLIPADGMAGVKRFVVDAAMKAGGKVCPPTIMGVGVGGTVRPLHAPGEGRGHAAAGHAAAPMRKARRWRPSCRRR